MPKATKFVVHFDDGSTYEIPAEAAGSIFNGEEKAKKCGHKPPYKKPPKTDAAATADTALTAETTATEDTTMESGCFVLNGVVVCP